MFDLVQEVVFQFHEERHFKEYILTSIMNDKYIPYNLHIKEVLKINENTIEDAGKIEAIEGENIKALLEFTGG